METTQIELKPFYVYELVDSRNDQVFYVGKGTGKRVQQHAKDAKNDNSTPKLKRINEIHAAGGKVIERVRGRYDTSVIAFAVESTLIHGIYGFDNLTNEQPGHGAEYIRDLMETKEHVDGIDVEITKGVNDGKFTAMNEAMMEKYGTVEYMQGIKNQLEEFTNYEITEPEITHASRFVRLYINVGPWKINIFKDGNSSLAVKTELTHETNDKAAITHLVENSEFYGVGKNAWAKLPDTATTKDFDDLIKYITAYYDEITKYVEVYS